MLALYCLYSGGVSGWVGGVETLYWRVETTVTGRERKTERGQKERGDAYEEEDEGGQQTKEKRKEKNVRRMKSNQLSNQASKDEKIRSNPKTEANSK